MQNAQARLDTLRARDFEASYQYTTPGYRSTENVGQYGTRYSGSSMWTGAQVVRVECEDIEPPPVLQSRGEDRLKHPSSATFAYPHFRTGCGSVATGTYIKIYLINAHDGINLQCYSSPKLGAANQCLYPNSLKSTNQLLERVRHVIRFVVLARELRSCMLWPRDSQD